MDPDADACTSQLLTINNWGIAALTPSSRQWLAGLPPKLSPAPDVLIVHGSVSAVDEIVDADAKPYIPTTVYTVAAGHLHKPFIIRTPRGLWVNAGSAGRPCDGDPRAAFALLEGQTWHYLSPIVDLATFPLASWSGALSTFVAGLAYGYAFMRSESVVAPWLAHAIAGIVFILAGAMDLVGAMM
jgi:hypothetical protein